LFTAVQNLIRTTDAAVARAYLSVFRERTALLPFLFHTLFEDDRQIALNLLDPQDRMTVASFRRFVKYYLAHGYQFVGPEAILGGLAPGGRYALITFDDGYFNNRLALTVLEELGVPALFFISTDNIRLGKCFWWDVLHRERVERKASPAEVELERRWLKTLRTEQIEEYLVATFGPGCLSPRGNIDRPFTVDELREFSRHPWVRIGNHTANHAILTNYPLDEARGQVARGQAWLTSTTGVTPDAIAYPNGAYNQSVIRTSGEIGLKLGFIASPQKCLLPLDSTSDRLLRIGRFTPRGGCDMEAQGRTYRSDLQLYGTCRALYLSLSGREQAAY
jgi:peptidoglycan/xylan/chitin deacetylase (PgdA/CDA1 family)